ncbi:MAG: response regulator [Prochlorothrix sp.]|nr:response regulator [Prochlorothrix sp.]
MVEDSDEDFEALVRTFKKLGTVPQIQRLADGDEALDYLEQLKADSRPAGSVPLYPYVILLDLNLPGTDGREVLEVIKQDSLLKQIPVVIFSSSMSQRDVQNCYTLGANSYLIKPMGMSQLLETIRLFLDYWFRWVVIA